MQRIIVIDERDHEPGQLEAWENGEGRPITEDEIDRLAADPDVVIIRVRYVNMSEL